MARCPGAELDDEADQHGNTIGAGGSNRRTVSIGSRSDKRRIRDEFVAVTGTHRKHAIRFWRVVRRGHRAIGVSAFVTAAM